MSSTADDPEEAEAKIRDPWLRGEIEWLSAHLEAAAKVAERLARESADHDLAQVSFHLIATLLGWSEWMRRQL